MSIYFKRGDRHAASKQGAKKLEITLRKLSSATVPDSMTVRDEAVEHGRDSILRGQGHKCVGKRIDPEGDMIQPVVLEKSIQVESPKGDLRQRSIGSQCSYPSDRQGKLQPRQWQ